MGLTYADDAPSTWPAEAAHAASELDDEVTRTRRTLRAAAGAQFVWRLTVALLVGLGVLNLMGRCSA